MEAKDTFFSKKQSLNIRGRLFSPNYPLVMGIINTTPDSFYSGSRANETTEILKRCENILRDGGEIIDIGAYSSRPEAENISTEEEKQRLAKVLGVARKEFPEAIFSIDTFRSEVAKMAVKDFGADMVNDISGGTLDNAMFETIALLKVPYILMHMRGTPQTMRNLNNYEDIITELIVYFVEKVNILRKLGVADIIIDPGFGFAKNIAQNFILLQNLKRFEVLNLPVLAGVSRKSFIYKTLGIEPEDALTGTISMNTVALMNGADILRAHDVKEAVQCVKLFRAFQHRD
jgi:dihydropteroate synthase